MGPAHIDRTVLPEAATVEPEPAISPARDRRRPFTLRSLAPYGYISPTLLLTMIITIVGSLQVFAQIAVLTQGGPGMSTTVLVYYLYQQAFQFHRFGYGATISILLFAIVALLTFAQWQMRRRVVFYEN